MKYSQTPKRWLETKGRAPEGAEKLLSSAMPSRSMTEDEKARSLIRLSALMDMGPSGGGNPGGSPGAPASSGGLNGLGSGASNAMPWSSGAAGAVKAKIGAGLISLAGVGAGVALLWALWPKPMHPMPEEGPKLYAVAPEPILPPDPSILGGPGRAAPSSVPIDVNALPDAPPSDREKALKRSLAPHPKALDSTQEDTPKEDTLAEELKLVGAAERHLSHDPARALQKLEQHAHAFPEGKLKNERELLRVRALLRLNRRSEAEQLGSALPEGSLMRLKAQQALEPKQP